MLGPLLVAALCGLLLVDHRAGLVGTAGVAGVKLPVAAAAVALVAAAPWLGARALPWAAGLAGAASLGLSLFLRLGAGDGAAPLTSDEAFGLTEPAALLALLLLVALRGRRHAALACVLVLQPAIVLRPLAIGVSDTGLFMALFLALATTAVLGAGVARRLVLADRRHRAAAVRLEQRAEFARDLHDFVAHHVTGIVVQAQGALAIAGRRPELVPPALERIERAGSEALVSMRKMVGMLRGEDELPPAPSAGVAELRSLVERFSAGGRARASLVLEGVFDDLPVEVGTTVHRVVMEALTNVRRHTRDCAEVEVHAVRSGDLVTVRVVDDGRTLQPSGGGFGLRGLAERAALVGGRFRAGPVPGGGWGVEVVLPAAPAASAAPSPEVAA
ncbi:sensor histidine kinase [Streptomyces sp. NPDC056600]|uniref:sensor histidine kinase n=1 Tax=Streptomyces sp. NPDC056600 TaxID=3345874 RepID=UPI0036BD323E